MTAECLSPLLVIEDSISVRTGVFHLVQTFLLTSAVEHLCLKSE